MKIKGKKIEGPNAQYLVIPRGNGEDIVLKLQAVMNMAPFDKLCPRPEPGRKMVPGGKVVVDTESKDFRNAIDTWASKRSDYLILMSLQATEGLEWETVKLDQPETWGKYQDELRESGFSDNEINRIVNAAIDVNCLDESKLEEARQRFLAGLAESQNGHASQKEGQPNTQSGKVASDSESNPRATAT